MKGIILAGGTGSRLFPLTTVTNKHLLPVAKYPMIFYPIAALKEAGIKEILIVSGTNHVGDFVNLLGSGNKFGLDFTYKVQDQSGGIAEALGLARSFVHEGPMLVVLGDNIFQDSLASFVELYKKSSTKAMIILKEVNNPERYGVATLDSRRKIVKITEKPKEPESSFAVTGIYFYESSVFNYIDTLSPSARGELEITDVNNWYIKQEEMLSANFKGFWTDAGTHSSLLKAHELSKVLDKRISKILNIKAL